MKVKKAVKLVEETLPSKRYSHSMRVAETGKKMAEIFDGDIKKVELAGILHDLCKYEELSSLYQSVTEYELGQDLLSYGKEILHGPVAAARLKDKYDIDDEEVYHAIYYHTTGRAHMYKTEKIIFVADNIEPGRTHDGVDEIREIVFKEKNLDKAIYEISKRTVLNLVNKDRTVHFKTVECLNYYNLHSE